FDSAVKSSKSKLYNDDGLTSEAFEKGRYEIINFSSETAQDQLQIHIDLDKGNILSVDKKINLIVHNLDRKPKKIRLNGEKVRTHFDKKTKSLTLDLICGNIKSNKVIIRL